MSTLFHNENMCQQWLGWQIMLWSCSGFPFHEASLFPDLTSLAAVSVCRSMAGHHVHHEPQLALAHQLHHHQQHQLCKCKSSMKSGQCPGTFLSIISQNHIVFQVQLVTCCDLFISVTDLGYIPQIPSKSIGNFPEVLPVENYAKKRIAIVFPLRFVRLWPCFAIVKRL